MKKKIIMFCIFILILTLYFSFFVSANTLKIFLMFDKRDNSVKLTDLKMLPGDTTNTYDSIPGSGKYKLVLEPSNKEIYVSPDFVLDLNGEILDLNRDFETFFVVYDNEDYLKVYYNDMEKLSVMLNLCNKNGFCENGNGNFENYYSCSDCEINADDGVCVEEVRGLDGICDPDCGGDLDCNVNFYGHVQIFNSILRNQSDFIVAEILYDNMELYIRNATSDFDGNFVLEDLPRGKIIKISIKPSHYLRRLFELDFVFWEFYNDFYDFGFSGRIGEGFGDFNNDNQVDFFDLGPFSGSFGSDSCEDENYNIYVDYNGDCHINFLDIGPLSGSYGKSGDDSLFSMPGVTIMTGAVVSEEGVSKGIGFVIALVVVIVVLLLWLVLSSRKKKRRNK